jgi:hypothetical protein
MVRPEKSVHHMATNSRPMTGLAIIHILLGVVGLLGWLALALLAYLHELPPRWPDREAPLRDIVLAVILLCGPAYFASGIGLLKRRRWARLLAMGCDAIAGSLAITGFALACSANLPIRNADFTFLALFVGFSAALFVNLRKESFVGSGQEGSGVESNANQSEPDATADGGRDAGST